MLSPQDIERIRGLSFADACAFHRSVWDAGDWPSIAALGRVDRFFLLVWLLNRPDANKEWVYQRCREVEAAPDGYLDLWARFHFKSSLITTAGIIQEIAKNPEITIGIFSHSNKVARKFLGQIKIELESNRRLYTAYPEVLYESPEKESPRWSEERGIIVKRKGNPKEATVEAHGLVDGMPTGAHYDLLVYDDVVTQESVTTPEQMAKTTEAWELSRFLGKQGGRSWHVGTRYHYGDTYREIMEKGAAIPRIHPATDDGTPTGKPVFWTQEQLDELRKTQSAFTYSSQMLLNPVADQAQGFKREWLKYAEPSGSNLNKYVLVDPANERKRNSDYTAMLVVGLGADRNYYILDIVRDRLNLTGRADTLFALHAKWKPIAVGYEKYGKDSDIQHFEDRMRRENYRFSITPLGGRIKKEDRIRALIPLFEQGRVYLPEACFKNSDGRNTDLIRAFVEQEYLAFPVGVHDDMLDCLARILDPDLPSIWPKLNAPAEGDRYERKNARRGGSWMSA